MTWPRPRRRRRGDRYVYEADDWNSDYGDGGDCLGTEPRRHPEHAGYDACGPAEETAGFERRPGGFAGRHPANRIRARLIASHRWLARSLRQTEGFVGTAGRAGAPGGPLEGQGRGHQPAAVE